MTNTLQGIYNKKISSKVKIGSREYVDANIIGDMLGMAIQTDRTKKDITLCNVISIPYLFYKLISLTTIMNKVVNISYFKNMWITYVYVIHAPCML